MTKLSEVATAAAAVAIRAVYVPIRMMVVVLFNTEGDGSELECGLAVVNGGGGAPSPAIVAESLEFAATAVRRTHPELRARINPGQAPS